MPEAYEQETWGHPTFRVRGAIFASTSADGLVAIIKASPLDQAELIASNPTAYSKADYFGRFGWVRVHLAVADPREIGELLEEGWRRAAPKRMITAADSADPAPQSRRGQSRPARRHKPTPPSIPAQQQHARRGRGV
ncbi:MmcQ/YjbR family DNA-binding protein [Rhizocola hellebori]|nr:MmcQ/YjbR family DNA-binding protein [Rhizocola hellebori]